MNGQRPTIQYSNRKAIVVIIEILPTITKIRDIIQQSVSFSTNGSEYNSLLFTVRNAIVKAIFSCLQSGANERKEFGNYNENLHEAIDALSFYGVPIELAAGIVNNLETSFIKNILDFFPHMDDISNYYVQEYKFLKDGNLAIMIEVRV